MPSNLHEWLLELFRNRSDSAADLLRNLNATLPAYDRVRIESPDVNPRNVSFKANLPATTWPEGRPRADWRSFSSNWRPDSDRCRKRCRLVCGAQVLRSCMLLANEC